MPSEPATAPERPSPESLLRAAAAERRGHLKVFLGAAPGVGKTYAMLEAAHVRKSEGSDVAVGFVETHGRKETERLTLGLEALPRRRINYQGRILEEMDLDAALTRRPKLLIVDELAHSNAPGSRHPKRYQDVDEILAAGIDVYTTLNVQHLESLNDVVARITRIRVRETLPDSVLQNAAEVELVDLTPEDLIQRLRDGKVYVPETAERAAKHYFKAGNLAALRELALRRTAERVDEQMVDYMRRHAIAGPWPAGERILVCVSEDPVAPRLVRTARRMAEMLDGKWSAAYIEGPKYYRLDEAARDRIAATLRLAQELGGDTVRLPGAGRDLPGELLAYAQANNFTQIVVGRSRRPRWVQLLRGSLVTELLRRSRGVAIHVLTGEDAEAPMPRSGHVSARFDWRPFALSALAVAAAGGVAKGIESLVDLSNLSMVFLSAVLYAAVTWGLWPSLLASLLSAAVYNFFFLPPVYTFTIARPEEVLSLGIFFVVAILTSHLAGRLRLYAVGAQQRMRTSSALLDFSRKLAGSPTLDNLLWAIAFQVASTLRGKAVVLLPEAGKLALRVGYPPEDTLGAAETAAANWAIEHGEAAGRHSATLPNADMLFLPMKTGQRMVGVIGLRTEADTPLDPEQRRTLDALIDLAAVAIERSTLEDEMQATRLLSETEKLRGALLSSISHDLRTPLSSIIGSATSLLTDNISFSEAARRDLLLTIQEEAERLNRFVGNLLDMTRLESGALQLKRDWVDIADLVGAAVSAARGRLNRRRMKVDIAPDLPLIRADFVLFQQVLINLLDNAGKFAPDDSTICVTGRRAGGEAMIEVTDQGPGVPPDDLERIFDKFYRVRTGDRQATGTGLGLSICRGIVEAHGGKITASSPVEGGRGAAFIIRLPIEAQPSAPSQTGDTR